jgi:predicted TIM-barrel fold metal-dependent hydrolase
MTTYDYVSADSHLECSPESWRPWVDPDFREWVPQVVKLDDGGDGLLFKDAVDPLPITRSLAGGYRAVADKMGGRKRSLSFRDGIPGSGGPDQRVEELDRDGVDAEVLFPALAGHFKLSTTAMPPAASEAIARGYNDWLAKEFCAYQPDRLIGCAWLPTSGVDAATAEMRRVRSLPGIRTVLLSQWPNGSGVPVPEADEAFWAAAVEIGMPLSVHGSIGGGRAAEQRNADPLRPTLNQLLTRGGIDIGYSVTQLITSRIFERFPTLRFQFAEAGAGWVPFYAEQSDTFYERHRYFWDFELEHPPSWYVRRHFAWGIQDDYVCIGLRHRIGVENLMWATDFPHHATDWPRSHELIDRLLDGVPDDERRRIVGGNATEFYQLGGPEDNATRA